MTDIKFDDYRNLTPEIMTNLYLYGSETGKEKPVQRPKNAALNIEVEMKGYMTDGPGRFAYPSNSKFVGDFLNGKISLPDGVYIKDDLIKSYKRSNGDFNFTLNQVAMAPSSEDYKDRVYIYASTSFEISDVAKFVVKGKDRYIENMAVHAHHDDFDFNSGNRVHRFGNWLKLQSKIDPDNLGRIVKIKYQDKKLVPVTPVYRLEDFLKDREKFATVYKPEIAIDSSYYDANKAMDELLPFIQNPKTLTQKDIHKLMGADAYWKSTHPDHERIHKIVSEWYGKTYGIAPQKTDATGKPVRPAPLPPHKPALPGKPGGRVHVRAHIREGGKEKVKEHERGRPAK